MKIIRDEEGLGLFMIPLFSQWGIKRCHVEGCKNLPTTILANPGAGIAALGMCEEHFQKGREAGEMEYTFVLDDFDAFEYQKENTSGQSIQSSTSNP